MQTISTPTDGKYAMQLVLIGAGFDDFENYMYQGFDFDMDEFSEAESPIASNIESKPITESKPVDTPAGLPVWVKNNARWWQKEK